RHTRWPRDWSSDVCSSDLEKLEIADEKVEHEVVTNVVTCIRDVTRRKIASVRKGASHAQVNVQVSECRPAEDKRCTFDAACEQRSEERRVGKECRSRWGMG